MTERPAMRFQEAGPIRRGSFYIERAADRELLEALGAGQFCYVLAPRQIGKSSLRLSTQARLGERGVRSASVDLTRIGSAGATPDSWYYSLAEEIALTLRPGYDPASYWEQHMRLTPPYRFTRFLRDELVSQAKSALVICVDEIEVTLDLPFSRDDFFAAIRAVYNARAEDPIWERLTFCLFGVASPDQLMADAMHTPFNIGRAIRLSDFSRDEATMLLPGLSAAGGDARALLDAVLEWTSGHPYMTQKLCGALVDSPERERSGTEKERVDELVRKLFLERGRIEDPNLYYAEMRLNHLPPGALKTEIFRLYRSLLYSGPILARGSDAAHKELRLAGMVAEQLRPEGAYLVVRNRIFETVFDRRWLDEKTVQNPLTEPVAQWLRFQKGEDFLLQGVALEVAREWAADRRDDLTTEEHEFLEACTQAQQRRAAAAQRARERTLVAGLGGAIVLALVTAVALVQEHARTEQIEAQRKKLSEQNSQLEQQVAHAEHTIERVKHDSDNKAKLAAERASAAENEAAGLKLRADELRAQGTVAQKEADILKQQAQDAELRAAQERTTAAEAKKLAQDAAGALKRSKDAELVAQNALETERAGRELAEKQLQEEREHRNRVATGAQTCQDKLRDAQREIITLGKQTCFPSAKTPNPLPLP